MGQQRVRMMEQADPAPVGRRRRPDRRDALTVAAVGCIECGASPGVSCRNPLSGTRGRQPARAHQARRYDYQTARRAIIGDLQDKTLNQIIQIVGSLDSATGDAR